MAKAGRYIIVFALATLADSLARNLIHALPLGGIPPLLGELAHALFWFVTFVGARRIVYGRPLHTGILLRLAGVSSVIQVLFMLLARLANRLLGADASMLATTLHSLLACLLWIQLIQLAFKAAFPDSVIPYSPVPRTFVRPGAALFVLAILGAGIASLLYSRWLFSIYTNESFMGYLALLRGPRVVLAGLPDLLIFCFVCYLFDRLFTAHNTGGGHRAAV